MQNLDLYKELIEYDLNPFILFNVNGKLKNYNAEAEFLLNSVSIKELYELAILNAPKSFGFEYNYISLGYNKLRYYAILVGYINEDEIALRLYRVVSNQIYKIDKDKLKSVNIFSLIEIAKNSTLINSNLILDEIYDVSIPEIKLDINNFLLSLNECFKYFSNDDKISLHVEIKVGEYEIVDNIKYKIVVIKFVANREIESSYTLQEKIIKANGHLFIDKNVLSLEFTIV